MPRIYLCFLWHMHQPFYKDLISGEYKLPWTRLHALKDYYGMVHMLEEFPSVRQTFNLVPSMMVQVEEYASGQAQDPFLYCALKPAEDLLEAEQEFILQHFFHAHPPRMIYRFPRYGELYEDSEAQKPSRRPRHQFSAQAFRDLQVLSQLAWFEESLFTADEEIRGLVSKGRDYTLEDQQLMGRKQSEILGLVIPAYERLAASGQIEISTTPYYHPILPLVCDSNIASVSHPNVALPSRFRYPDDARKQLEMAMHYIERKFGTAPRGLWPSEGSVSDEVFGIASKLGFQWTATDNGVLERTLGRPTGLEDIYRPYHWRQGGGELRAIFRDHFLSDLIGFVYSRMGAREAASDFMNRIRENCRGILGHGRDALVPIILDGENAWEYYEQNGRPFLRELYRQISEDPVMVASTVSEALARIEAAPLDHIFPGSWISANFDVWIGAEEDNRAWEYLLRARETFDRSPDTPPDRKALAYEELLIAEGSDWCWWYGPEHDSANRVEFDQLYRDHLTNVYRALGRVPPEELSRPILKNVIGELQLNPTYPIRPVIDGEITSYFEWMGAGLYRVDARPGSMHGKRYLVREVYYGTDGSNLFLRIDFRLEPKQLSEAEARIHIRPGRVEAAPDASVGNEVVIRADANGACVTDVNLTAAGTETVPVECAFDQVLEMRISLAALGVKGGQPVCFQISLWQGGLPMDAVPQQGWLEFSSSSPGDW